MRKSLLIGSLLLVGCMGSAMAAGSCTLTVPLDSASWKLSEYGNVGWTITLGAIDSTGKSLGSSTTGDLAPNGVATLQVNTDCKNINRIAVQATAQFVGKAGLLGSSPTCGNCTWIYATVCPTSFQNNSSLTLYNSSTTPKNGAFDYSPSIPIKQCSAS